MIKIFLNSLNCCSAEWRSYSFVEWEKGNKRYRCFRNINGGIIIYSLYIINLTNLRIAKPIISESLADINTWLEKTKVKIEER